MTDAECRLFSMVIMSLDSAHAQGHNPPGKTCPVPEGGLSSRVTALEVAQLAGVPSPDAILILNDVPGLRVRSDTRQRVLGAARELDYRIPTASEIQGRVAGKNCVLAVVERRPAAGYFTDVFAWQVMHGVFQAAIPRGFDILPFVVPHHDGLRRCRAIVRRFNPGGIILSSPQAYDLELIEWLAKKVPVVVLGFFPGCPVPSVRVDDYEVGRKATDHLLRSGHRCFAAALHAPLRFPEVGERLRGYEETLLENDIDVNPEMIAVAGFGLESGHQAGDMLLRAHPRPSAVFASSDAVAMGVLEAARRVDVPVPGGLAVVGFGDIPAAVLSDPQLTTVRAPAFAMGWMVADMLVRMLSEEGTVESSVVLPTELIVRQSCGALNTEAVVEHIRVDVIH